MEKQKNSSWLDVLYNPITLLAYIIVISLIIALTPPKVSEWTEVTVVSRIELTVPCGLGYETEVTLIFSDGSTWKGYPSSVKTSEQHLLYSQKGDVECYRYNSHYFTKKQWR
ncbi:MAG: hypothetical protein IKW39_00425 [Alphaproteobacteria bacterium]|nr:hypothetical protein [Alphaproteobacteria bacterium]